MVDYQSSCFVTNRSDLGLFGIDRVTNDIGGIESNDKSACDCRRPSVLNWTRNSFKASH